MLDCQKPKKRRQPAVKTYRDGREVCSNNIAGITEYKRRTVVMWYRQNGLCSICGGWMNPNECTCEHSEGRGMNGGHRDDRIEIDGKPYNSASHGLCNVKKGSVRLSKFKGEVA